MNKKIIFMALALVANFTCPLFLCAMQKRSFQPVLRNIIKGDKLINSLCVTNDGKSVISVGDYAPVKEFDIKTEECLYEVKWHFDGDRYVCVTPERYYYFGQNKQNGFYKHKVWCIETGVPETILEFDPQATSFCIAPDKKKIIFGTSNGVKVFDFSSGKLLWGSDEGNISVGAVCVAPDRSTLISSDDTKTIKLWDLKTGKLIKSFLRKSVASAVCMTSDSQYIFLGDYDGSIQCLNIKTGDCVLSFAGHKKQIRALAVFGNKLFVAVGSDIYSYEIKMISEFYKFENYKDINFFYK